MVYQTSDCTWQCERGQHPAPLMGAKALPVFSDTSFLPCALLFFYIVYGFCISQWGPEGAKKQLVCPFRKHWSSQKNCPGDTSSKGIANASLHRSFRVNHRLLTNSLLWTVFIAPVYSLVTRLRFVSIVFLLHWKCCLCSFYLDTVEQYIAFSLKYEGLRVLPGSFCDLNTP